MKPIATIYITNYNYGEFIEHAIESLLAQTFISFEILIIDDGSNDNSSEIISRYQKLDDVFVVYQKNKGLAASNNIAIKMARGKYIMRLDADDYLAKNCLEVLIKKLEDNSNLALVFPDYYEVDINGKILNHIIRHDFDKDVTLFDNPAHGACTMFRTKVLREIGGYDENFSRQDGYYIWLKIIEFGYKVSNINSPLFYYRKHGNNLTKNEDELLNTRSKIIQKHVDDQNYENKSILCIIPVRGSKIDPRSKPLKMLGDKFLIDWTLEFTINAKLINQIIVSTSDEDLIKYLELNYSKTIKTHKRRLKLSQINKSINQSIEEIVFNEDHHKIPDYILVVNIEYPFRKSNYLNKAINLMKIHKLDSVIGVRLDDNIFFKHTGRGLRQITRNDVLRLERDELYKKVGGISLVTTEYFKKSKSISGGKLGYIQMPKIADIAVNNDIDWTIAESIVENFLKNNTNM